MPDSIADEKALKRPLEKNKELIKKAEHKTREYISRLKVDTDKCIGCGLCVKLCPMNNITIKEQKAVIPSGQTDKILKDITEV